MIDLHAHFWPTGLLRALASRQHWYGWEAIRDEHGIAGISLREQTVMFRPPEIDLDDLAGRLSRRLEREGVTAEAVQPVGFLWGDHLDGPAAAAYCREINAELAVRQAEAPERFRGVGLLPFFAPEEFEPVFEEAMTGGLRAFACPTNIFGRNLDEPDIQELLAQLVARDCAVFVHPTYLAPIGKARLERYYLHNTLGAPLESAIAALSLVQGGFFERYPGARMIFANGGGCAALEIGRLDRRHATREDCRTIDEVPSVSLKRGHFDSLVLQDESLRLLLSRVGIERIMVGTDYPFRTDVEEGALAWITGLAWLDQSSKRAILHENAQRFLATRLLATEPG